MKNSTFSDKTRFSSSGKSSLARGREKEYLAIFWLYFFGWSTTTLIDFLAGGKSSGLSKRLEKNGLVKIVETQNPFIKKIVMLTKTGLQKIHKIKEHDLLSFADHNQLNYVYQTSHTNLPNLLSTYPTQKIARSFLVRGTEEQPVKIIINPQKDDPTAWWLTKTSPCDFLVDSPNEQIGVVVKSNIEKGYGLDMLVTRCVFNLLNGSHSKIKFVTTSQVVADFYQSLFASPNLNVWLDDELEIYIDEEKINDYPFIILDDQTRVAIQQTFEEDVNNQEQLRLLQKIRLQQAEKAKAAHDHWENNIMPNLPTVLGELSWTKVELLLDYDVEYDDFITPIFKAHNKIIEAKTKAGKRLKVNGRRLFKIPMPAEISDRLEFVVNNEPAVPSVRKTTQKPLKTAKQDAHKTEIVKQHLLLSAAGKTTNERGLEKDKNGLTWLFRWGWTTAQLLDSLTGTVRRGHAWKLEKQGLIQKWELSPIFTFYTLTEAGLDYACVLNNNLIKADYDLNKAAIINKNLSIHDLKGQEITRDLFLLGKLIDFKTTKELLADQPTKSHKFFDVTWRAHLFNRNRARIGVEIELNEKYGERLDGLILRCLKSLNNAGFEAIFIFSSVKTIRTYETEFTNKRRISNLVAKNYLNGSMTTEKAMGILEKVRFFDITQEKSKIFD